MSLKGKVAQTVMNMMTSYQSTNRSAFRELRTTNESWTTSFMGAGQKKAKTSLELEEGQFVAVYCPKYVELPQIGRVLSVDDSNVEVEWWLGTYSGTWRVWKTREAQKYTIVTEILPRVAVLTGLEFTKAKRLPTAMAHKLKDLYKSALSQE